jgi:hypothetical protein
MTTVPNHSSESYQLVMKIVVVDEQRDVDCGDEECYEIDAAEFAKKVNLTDTMTSAASGKIALSKPSFLSCKKFQN